MNTILEDRAVARRHAIADLLDSEAVAYRRVIVGEPQCQYRVPFHAESFWFKVLVSDTDFVFEGEHRRRAAISVPFCAALKHGWRNVGATKILPELSAELGFKIYTTERKNQAIISDRLLAPAISNLLHQIDLVPVRVFLINPIQILITSELITPEHCAQQVHLFRELLLKLYQETYGSSED